MTREVGALVLLTLAATLAPNPAAGEVGFTIADGSRRAVIAIPVSPGPAESLAASEIARYVEQITGARLETVKTANPPDGAIVLSKSADPALGEEGYSIAVKNNRLHLNGARGRSVLYAAYDLLERLGCRWLAPSESPKGDFAPSLPQLQLPGTDVTELPKLKFRKLYVEEGHSHNQQNLVAMIDWMAKSRFNTLVVPTDYQGKGRVKWDNWREALTPELRKRDIRIEVGGHGYQNFLDAGVNGGKLFAEHPEWFGMYADGQRRPEHNRVFCTSNNGAVEYLTRNVVSYLQSHPEIDIFDFWPPDGARWCECEECAKLGEPADRQARLVAHVIGAAGAVGVKARFECIAYSLYTRPPAGLKMPESVLIDFCPIGQCFEYQIYDPASKRNAGYAEALKAWKKDFAGDISIYSYYRKYAWRSLPNIIPHYMQKDLKWYLKLGMAGVSSYAEPGDWRTYEINHYVLARLAWNPDADVDAIISEFTSARFGKAADAARQLYQALEDTVRHASSIPFSSLKSPEEIDSASAKLKGARDVFEKAADPCSAKDALLAAVDYALYDFALQKSISQKRPIGERRKMVDELAAFIQKHTGQGVFLDDRVKPEALIKAYRAAE